MELAYISHCLPYPPNKGERIRAFHEVKRLAATHRVHVACFTRGPEEENAIPEFRKYCASLYTEPISGMRNMAAAAKSFLVGRSIVAGVYASDSLQAYLRSLKVDGVVVYTAAMASSAPTGVPVIIDHVDLDSEKWFQYARTRHPSFLFSLEGSRFRKVERRYSQIAGANCLSTENERAVFAKVHPGLKTFCAENGVDSEFFDPFNSPTLPELENRSYIAFVGVMNYFPNSSGICWFASEVFPKLRKQLPTLELLVVGRDPSASVQKLERLPGITVTGAVPDVRPYLRSARAVIAPLPIARGIQNKVLESLAMDKEVLASPAVCQTFGERVPLGVLPCSTPDDYAKGLISPSTKHRPGEIRAATQARFSWRVQMDRFCTAVEDVVATNIPVSHEVGRV